MEKPVEVIREIVKEVERPVEIVREVEIIKEVIREVERPIEGQWPKPFTNRQYIFPTTNGHFTGS